MNNWISNVTPIQNWIYVLNPEGEYIRFTDEMKAYEYVNANFPSHILDDEEIKQLKEKK